jgi:nucleoside-diphosphate-sugar epimerase
VKAFLAFDSLDGGGNVDAALTERKALNIIVTGAAVGAGPAVVSALTKAGHVVRGIAATTAQAHLLRALGGLPIYADDARAGEVAALVRLHKVDALVDLGSNEANQTVVNMGWDAERLQARAAALAEAAQTGGAKLLVQVSHAFVYGDHGGHDDHGHGHGHHHLIDETTKPQTGGHPLLKAVVKAEKAALNIGGVVLRAGYGYGGHYSGLKQATDSLKRGGLLPSGEGVVNYLAAADLAEAIRRVAEAQPHGEVFNVSDGKPITSYQFVAALAAELGVITPAKLPSLVNSMMAGKPLADLLALSAPVSIAKITAALGFTPSYGLSAGLADALLTWRAAQAG